MRADDIRSIVAEASEKAAVQAEELRKRAKGVVREEEIDEYIRITEELARFWRGCSPAFCHAWFEVTAESASQ